MSDGVIDTPVGTLDGLPSWYPIWARRVAELYFSRTTSMFALHGNTADLVPLEAGEAPRFGTLADFLASQLFGRWDLVLHYDLARGLRCLAGHNQERLREMVALTNRRVGDLTKLKTPTATLAALDRFVQRNIMAKEEDRLSVAVVIDHASFVVPRGGAQSLANSTHLVTLLNLASSPYVKRLNLAFVLIDSQMSAIAERLRQSPHVASVEVPSGNSSKATMRPDSSALGAHASSAAAAAGSKLHSPETRGSPKCRTRRSSPAEGHAHGTPPSTP